MEDNYEFTETKVSTEYSQTLCLDKLLELGDLIWNDVKTDKSQTYEHFYYKYKDFAMSFPIVLKWMVEMKKYNKMAFKKFLLKYNTTNISDKNAFFGLQADYLVYIYMIDNKSKYTQKDLVQYKKSVVDQLISEDKEFEQIQKEYEDEMNREKKNNIDNIRQLLYKCLSHDEKK